MSHPSLGDVQAAYNFASIVYGHAFEMKVLLKQASESIQQDEAELLHFLMQAQEKANYAVLVTREVEQAVAQLLTATIKKI